MLQSVTAFQKDLPVDVQSNGNRKRDSYSVMRSNNSTMQLKQWNSAVCLEAYSRLSDQQ